MGIPERKEREKEHRSEEIINAAQEIFFKKGLPAATMDDIAAAAELSKGTLYLYYKSKEDLYLAVAMRGATILRTMFEKAVSSQEPTTQLIKNLGIAYFEYFKQHRDYFRMYYYFENPQLHRQVSEDIKQVCMDNDHKTWTLVIDLIQRGIREGLLKSDLDPVESAVILWSSMHFLMRQMDREDDYWKEGMRVDLESAMWKSQQFLLEGMMTEKAKKMYNLEQKSSSLQ